ncbi:MAG: type II toxin-antitoxin system VapC family toxin [Rhodoglobus sp.]
MKLLLDSNALLWLLAGEQRLGLKARRTLASAARLFVSDVTVFEIGIKVAAAKLSAPPGLSEVIDQLGVVRSGVRDDVLDAMRELPFHHGDPFDRYLIAQALIDSVPIVTSDSQFAQYGVRVIDARE